MTYALELFYNRRSRHGRNSTELGFDSAPDRNPHHPRRLHNNHRHDVNDCHPVRRSPLPRRLCHRLPHLERESVRLGHGTTLSGIGNSISGETSSTRTSSPIFPQDDRLPGAVLLARERLLQRLRGVSGNRSVLTSINTVTCGKAAAHLLAFYWDEFVDSDDLRLVDAGDWETASSREWLAEGASFSESSRTDLLLSLPDLSKKPPGLSQEAMNHLGWEVFGDVEIGDEGVMPRAAQECSICLERFQEGDGLIQLPCGHRFHSTCLDPWVRTCGDCPYCRAGIFVDYHRAEENS